MNAASRAGFTLFQLLIVIAIIGLVGVGAFQAYSNWFVSQTTVQAAQQIARDLDKWRLQAKLENRRYDVVFDTNSAGVTTYKYAARAAGSSTFSTTLTAVSLPQNVRVKFGSGLSSFSFKPPYGSVEANPSSNNFAQTQLTVQYSDGRSPRTVNLVSVLGRVVIK